MGLALTSALAFCLWVFLWGIGTSGLDGMLITLLILVLGATVKSLGKYLPSAARRSGSGGGW